MLSKSDKTALRSTIFRHLNGIATASAMHTLNKRGILDYLIQQKKVDIGIISKKFSASEGYLNVALRTLCSQGWLTQIQNNTENTVLYEINENSKLAFGYATLYDDVVNLLTYSVKFPIEGITSDAFYVLDNNFKDYKRNYGIKNITPNSIEYQVLKHIEGAIVAPIIVLLGVNGLFHKYFMEASFRAQEFHKNPENFKQVLDFFVFLGWFQKNRDTYRFTEKGLFFAKRATAYGVTVSYLPTFTNLDHLIFTNPFILKPKLVTDPE